MIIVYSDGFLSNIFFLMTHLLINKILQTDACLESNRMAVSIVNAWDIQSSSIPIWVMIFLDFFKKKLLQSLYFNQMALSRYLFVFLLVDQLSNSFFPKK